MTFDPTKPVQTRDGRKARIICTDALGIQPVVALISHCEGEVTMRFGMDGTYLTSDFGSDDLINIPEEPKTEKVWVAVFEEGEGVWCSSSYKTRGAAWKSWGGSAVAYIQIPVTYRPGEGLK